MDEFSQPRLFVFADDINPKQFLDDAFIYNCASKEQLYIAPPLNDDECVEILGVSYSDKIPQIPERALIGDINIPTEEEALGLQQVQARAANPKKRALKRRLLPSHEARTPTQKKKMKKKKQNF